MGSKLKGKDAPRTPISDHEDKVYAFIEKMTRPNEYKDKYLLAKEAKQLLEQLDD